MLIITRCKNELNDIHKDFEVAHINKATKNIAFVRKLFYASVIAKELVLNITLSTGT